MHSYAHYLLLATISLLVACGGDSTGGNKAKVESKKVGDNTVLIHDLADPDKLNPLTSSAANATYIQLNIFQQLLDINFETLELEGQLAVGRPEIIEIKEGEYDGGMSLAYEIRPEAVWDNGTPILASDYIFSVKAVKNPKVESANIRPYIEFIHDVVVDKDNPKKFTIYSKDKYILAEIFSSGFGPVLPEYIYDPQKVMRKFTIKQLNDEGDKLAGNADIQAFAKEFNSPKFAREKGFIVGSGPYNFVSWETGQRIILERKKDWWGDKVNAHSLTAGPDKIINKIVNDWTTAVTSVKDEGLDVVRSIRTADFMDLKDNDRVTGLYNLHTPTQLSYDYLGFNTKSPKLSDKRVRRAVAHLVDVDEIIDALLYGLGERLVGPIHPTKSYYHKGLAPIEFNVEKAKALLTEAGWIDSDEDGVVDKVIDGEKVDMTLEYKYNSGNDRRKNIGLLLKETAKRAGVNVEVVTREWTVFLEDTKKRDFDIMCLGWVQSPIPADLKQIWHTDSDTYDGANRVGFGNERSDKVIEAIRVTLDEKEREKLYHEIQEIIYEEQPYVFLCSPKNRLAIHSRFKADPSLRRPNFDEKNFQLLTPKATAQP